MCVCVCVSVCVCVCVCADESYSHGYTRELTETVTQNIPKYDISSLGISWDSTRDSGKPIGVKDSLLSTCELS